MAYTVAQLRKSKNLIYMRNVTSVTPQLIALKNQFDSITSSSGASNSDFYDLALTSRGSQVTSGFRRGQVYFLRFKVRRIPEFFYSNKNDKNHDADVLRLVIILKNYNDGSMLEDTQTGTLLYQLIGTCTIPTSTEQSMAQADAQYATFSMIFSPNKDYDSLVFRVQRTAYDVITHARNWLILDRCATNVPSQIIRRDGGLLAKENTFITTNNRQPNIFFCHGSTTEGDLGLLSNLVEQSDSTTNKNWLKFGYQGRPGDLLVVNKLPIRVGRSGIYEFNNGLLIDSFMIAQPNGSDSSNIDSFLLDYAYESS